MFASNQQSYIYGHLGSQFRMLGLCRSGDKPEAAACADARGRGYTRVFTSSFPNISAKLVQTVR